MNFDLSDTIVALSTPSGVGAIGVIRLSGPKAIALCNRAFKGKDLTKQTSHTIHFGTIRDEKDRVLDEVLVSLFIAPKSYTKEDVVEISCHGSPYILQQIIELFIRYGARMARAGEFTMRAFLNGQLDLSQAEAVADLINADSAAAHSIAMQQMRGGFSDEIQRLRSELIHFASLIELELDFSEEDVEFANRDDLEALILKIQTIIKDLKDSFQLGNVIKNGINTVIAGRPNAGKSTLLNALLNEERAIVSAIAGTTRDTIEEVLNIKGVTFRLIDTAGIRDATDQIEAIGVQKTMEKIDQSALLVYLFDANELSPSEVKEDLKRLERPGLQQLIVANKTDLLPRENFELALHQHFKDETVLLISAEKRDNIQTLKNTLYHTAISGKLNNENVIVTNIRHYEALDKAYASLADVLKGMSLGVTGDFLAQDIRHALIYLGQIVGTIDLDQDILGNIFSNFCIGK